MRLGIITTLLTSTLLADCELNTCDEPITKKACIEAKKVDSSKVYRENFKQRILSTNTTENPSISVDKNPPPQDFSKLSVITLIEKLTHSNPAVRSHAELAIHQRLQNTDSGNYMADLTHWQKYSKKAVRKHTKADLKLRVIRICQKLGDFSNVFIQECLSSEQDPVICQALEIAHLADNSVESDILKYKPNENTQLSYIYSLGKLATPEAHKKAQSILSLSDDSLLRASYLKGLGKKYKEFHFSDKALIELSKAASQIE